MNAAEPLARAMTSAVRNDLGHAGVQANDQRFGACGPGFDPDRKGQMDGHRRLHQVDHHPSVAGNRWDGKALEGNGDPMGRDQADDRRIWLWLALV